ncbi:hypothetical protein DFH28DRAFT_910518 [Melampsora americana]|nr:hypothetical protein DFH28DRAFT_910518 [Melampsora americana]
MLVKDLMAKLCQDYPNTYDSITVSQLETLASLAGKFLKRTDDVYGPSPTESPIEFLLRCLDPEQTPKAWAQIWPLINEDLPDCIHNSSHFFTQGIPPQIHAPDAIIIPEHTFNPPFNHCLTCKIPIKMGRQIYGYLLNVTDCNTTYTPCSICCADVHKYYSIDKGQPKLFFQASQHYVMTHKLANHFNHLQMLAQMSVYNLVNSYNHMHAPPNVTYPNNIRSNTFTRWMNQQVCLLGVDVHQLMRAYNQCGLRLKSDTDMADN